MVDEDIIKRLCQARIKGSQVEKKKERRKKNPQKQQTNPQREAYQIFSFPRGSTMENEGPDAGLPLPHTHLLEIPWLHFGGLKSCGVCGGHPLRGCFWWAGCGEGHRGVVGVVALHMSCWRLPGEAAQQ